VAPKLVNPAPRFAAHSLAAGAALAVGVSLAAACASGARTANAAPGPAVPPAVELLAPTTVTVSAFRLPQSQLVSLVRTVFGEKGVRLRPGTGADTLLVSEPVPAGPYEVTYRVRLVGGSGPWLVAMDAAYRLVSSADGMAWES